MNKLKRAWWFLVVFGLILGFVLTILERKLFQRTIPAEGQQADVVYDVGASAGINDESIYDDPEPPWVIAPMDHTVVGWSMRPWNMDERGYHQKNLNQRGYHIRDEVTKEQVDVISECPGVADAWIGQKYSVWVIKAPMYQWDELEGCILIALNGVMLHEIEYD
jgi:hypothetical protein